MPRNCIAMAVAHARDLSSIHMPQSHRYSGDFTVNPSGDLYDEFGLTHAPQKEWGLALLGGVHRCGQTCTAGPCPWVVVRRALSLWGRVTQEGHCFCWTSEHHVIGCPESFPDGRCELPCKAGRSRTSC